MAKQQQRDGYTDFQMRELANFDVANVLLQQMNSQGDHFSQRDLALLTSISSQQDHDEISRIEGESDASFLHLDQPKQLLTTEDDGNNYEQVNNEVQFE